MDWETRSNGYQNFLEMSYGRLTAFIFYEKLPERHYIRVSWRVDDGSKCIFEQHEILTLYDIIHKYRYRPFPVTEQEILLNEIYPKYKDIARTALFCAVVEKLHAAHNCGF